MTEVELLYRKLNKKDNTFKSTDSSYLFTTENIKEYMPNLDSMNVLTVTSSGDHYFNTLLNGADNVDLFDINRLTINILKLKKTAIENLDLDVFLKFFDALDDNNIFNYDIYLKFNKYLDKESYLYWENIYTLANHKGYNIIKSNIFYEFKYSVDKMIEVNDYLEEQNYIKLQRILKNIRNINFINSDIFALDKHLDKKYDAMFLSNINEYYNEEYINLLSKLDDYLNEYGNIYFAYLYNYEVNPQNNFYSELIKKDKNMYSQIITGMDSYLINSKFKDKVLVYSKG